MCGLGLFGWKCTLWTQLFLIWQLFNRITPPVGYAHIWCVFPHFFDIQPVIFQLLDLSLLVVIKCITPAKNTVTWTCFLSDLKHYFTFTVHIFLHTEMLCMKKMRRRLTVECFPDAVWPPRRDLWWSFLFLEYGKKLKSCLGIGADAI